MLEDIINSKHESAVLSFFLVAPERAFSAIELAKRLSIPYLKVAHVLNKLAVHGQLKAFSKKAKKYYIINTKYKLMPEIKSYLIKNGPTYQDELFIAIKKLGEVKAAFLSGLFTGYANLPVDILLVGKINLSKLSEFMTNVEKLMGQEVNYSVMTVEEFVIRRNTFDKFIKDIFDYRHIVVVDEIGKRTK
jgi:hypothetical protein